MVKLVLVNKKDEELGVEEKLKCHQGKGILHRAFTVFIFNKKGELLIQKRSKNKFLWPLCWEASCSSHPEKGETYLQAGKKCLKKELRISCQLRFLTKFYYHVPYKNIGSEHELCALLIGKYNNGKIKPNPKEVTELKWINPKELAKKIKKEKSKYAPWLIIALKKYFLLKK